MKSLLILTVLVIGCGKGAPDNDPSAEPSTPPIEDTFKAAEFNLHDKHLEGGWVCSRDPARPGYCVHAGDSLLWTSLWMGAASCSAGDSAEATLQAMIRDHDGALVRFDDKRPEFAEHGYPGGREISADGAMGLYTGVAQRIKRCPESRASWADVMKIHQTFLEDHDGRLHSNVRAVVPPGFDLILDLLLADLSGSAPPSDSDRRLGSLMVQSAAGAYIVKKTKAAAFRIHLAYVAIEGLEALGFSVPDPYRWGEIGFCVASKGIGLLTVDNWCGRSGLSEWVQGFVPNEYEFRLQRAVWEDPDGKGYVTPRLDLLVGMRELYDFPF